ncbi:MAG: hypothetical protein ACFB02_20540 [Mastigocoleus sp.]
MMKCDLSPSIASYHTEEVNDFVYHFKYGVWLICSLFWIAGICDRFIATLTDSFLSYGELSQLFIVISLFFGWLCLKPELIALHSKENHNYRQFTGIDFINIRKHQEYISTMLPEGSIYPIVPQEHLLSKAYVLPGSYWVNMFHTLNPMHLNHVHKITQNGLIITEVLQFLETHQGGVLTFTSVMKKGSMMAENIQELAKYIPIFNLFKKYIDTWRQNEFTYQLILHNRYTTEVHIPSGKHYTSFIFNVYPLENNQCKLFVDFYSSLPIPKIFQWIALQVVIPIVVWEDKSYLLRLSKKDPEFFRIIRKKVKDTHFLRLSQRFLELYG